MTKQTPEGDAKIIDTNTAQASAPVAPVAPAPEPAPAATAAQPAPVAPEPAPTATPAPEQSGRTSEQFDKLLTNNKKLFEANELFRKELASRAQTNQQFKPVNQPPVKNPTPAKVNPQDFIEVDPVSGERYIDENKLEAKINELNSKTTQAQEAITKYMQVSEQRESDRQSAEAFADYPDLDPGKPSFDVKFSNQTRAIIYDSLINPQDYGGRPLSFKAAATFVASSTKRETVSEPKQTAQPAPVAPATPAPEGEGKAMLDQAQAIKDQASASVQGGTQPTRTGPVSADSEALVQATRHGNIEALAKRLANLDSKDPDDQALTS